MTHTPTCPGACDPRWLDTDVDAHGRHVDRYACRTCGDVTEKTRAHRPATPADPKRT